MCSYKKRRRFLSGVHLQMKYSFYIQSEVPAVGRRLFRKPHSLSASLANPPVSRPTKVIQKRVKRENSGNSDSLNGKNEGSTHVAWVAAIIINVFLILIIIAFVTYCYCRYRKDKKRRQANAVQDWNERSSERRTSSSYNQWESSSREGSNLFTVEGSSSYSQSRRKRRRRWKNEGKAFDHEDVRAKPYWNSRRFKRGSSRGVLVRKNFGSYPVADDDDDDGTRESSGYISNDTHQIRYFDNRTSLIGTGYDVRESALKGSEGSPRRFLVYQSRILTGKPRNVGHVMIPKGLPLTLYQLRSFLREAETPVREIATRRFHFLTENLRLVREDERDTLVDHVYPSKAIIIRLEAQDKRASSSVSKPKLEPVFKVPEKHSALERIYKTAPEAEKIASMGAQLRRLKEKGGLGVCHAPWCEKIALIKCSECNAAVYCSQRCMKEDKAEHKKVCYKPPWRL